MVFGIFIAFLMGGLIMGKNQLDADINKIKAANAKLDETVKQLKHLNKMLGGE